MKTYRELLNAAREILIEDVNKAQANYQGTPEALEDWLWQDVEPAVEKVVPEGMAGVELLWMLRQHPDVLNTNIELSIDAGTVQEILEDLLRNALYADFEPEAKTIIDAAVEERRAQEPSATP